MRKQLFCLLLLVACQSVRPQGPRMEYAEGFSVQEDGSVVLYAPDGTSDTLRGPYRRIVCMSSSYVGFLEALGKEDVIVGVSGLSFLADSLPNAVEVGYEAALDYEAVLSAAPDLLLAYTVSAAEPPFLAKLRELGIPVASLYEQLERHPLARAEYLKCFGALTGCRERADSVFSAVRDRYAVWVQPTVSRKVLINLPYADQWFIPGGDSYMARLFRDAGAELTGAVPGRRESSVIDMETAYRYAQEADFWFHPGWCRSKAQIRRLHPLFAHFPVLEKGVWNNTLQETAGGGNRFWESGPVRPDLILEDLVHIFQGGTAAALHYYLPVNEEISKTDDR